MAASLSLYRKYRSQTFDELVGQEPVVRTLKNAIRQARISHAYLFTGPRGVGKTSAARLLARAANCLSEELDKPCNTCANCTAALRDIATDLIEIDAASNTGVDNIRDVIERANFAPSVWHTKFYIIDEVHMLSVSAFNALLKTLEEPPPHVAFILATTEVHKVPATVASRCQRFDFRRVPLRDMTARLQYICDQEGIKVEPDALELVARCSTGSLRDAESLLDQLRVYSGEEITLESVQSMLGASGSEEVAAFVDSLIAGDLAAGLVRIGRVSDEGLDLRQFNRQVVEHLRSLMLVKSGATGDGTLLDVTAEMRSRMNEQASKVSMVNLLRWVKEFADADADIRSSAYRQLPLEMALVASVLPAQEPAARPVERDHGAEIARAVEQVGQVPPRAPQRVAESAASVRREAPAPVFNGGPPPPINLDLAAERAREPEPPPAPPEPELGPEYMESLAGPPAAEGDPLTLLQERWAVLVEQINARSKTVAAAFRDTGRVRPHSVDGKIVTLAFRYKIQADRSIQEPARSVIETALSRVLGFPCRLESVLFDDDGNLSGLDTPDERPGSPAGNGGSGPAKDRPSPYETPRGRAAMNIFGITKFDEPNGRRET